MVWLILIPIAAVCYWYAVRSRKTYRCPACGERVKTEHLKVRNCGMCGAPLEEIK